MDNHLYEKVVELRRYTRRETVKHYAILGVALFLWAVLVVAIGLWEMN